MSLTTTMKTMMMVSHKNSDECASQSVKPDNQLLSPIDEDEVDEEEGDEDGDEGMQLIRYPRA